MGRWKDSHTNIAPVSNEPLLLWKNTEMLVLSRQECGLDLCCVYQQYLCVTNESSVICFILLQKKMQTHSHNHHKPNYHLYSLRKCQPNHFEVVFVAAIDSALQEMQNIWLFIHSFIFVFECENYSFTVKLISFTVDHLSSYCVSRTWNKVKKLSNSTWPSSIPLWTIM